MKRLFSHLAMTLAAVGVALCAPLASAGVLPADVRLDAETESEFTQRVDLDEDTVLLAIALERTGFDVDFEDIVDIEIERRVEAEQGQRVDLDDDDVLLAIALSGGDLDGLGGLRVADTDQRVEDVTRIERDVHLDEDTALLAIVMANTIGAPRDINAILDIREVVEREVELDSDVDLDRDDVLLAIAAGV